MAALAAIESPTRFHFWGCPPLPNLQPHRVLSKLPDALPEFVAASSKAEQSRWYSNRPCQFAGSGFVAGLGIRIRLAPRPSTTTIHLWLLCHELSRTAVFVGCAPLRRVIVPSLRKVVKAAQKWLRSPRPGQREFGPNDFLGLPGSAFLGREDGVKVATCALVQALVAAVCRPMRLNEQA
jgi:hypothetical protein